MQLAKACQTLVWPIGDLLNSTSTRKAPPHSVAALNPANQWSVGAVTEVGVPEAGGVNSYKFCAFQRIAAKIRLRPLG